MRYRGAPRWLAGLRERPVSCAQVKCDLAPAIELRIVEPGPRENTTPTTEPWSEEPDPYRGIAGHARDCLSTTPSTTLSPLMPVIVVRVYEPSVRQRLPALVKRAFARLFSVVRRVVGIVAPANHPRGTGRRSRQRGRDNGDQGDKGRAGQVPLQWSLHG